MRVSEKEPTLFLGLRVWWAWVWRYSLVTFSFAAIFGGVIGVIGASVGWSELKIAGAGAWAGLIIAFIFGPLVFKWLMTKGFGKYRLQVVDKE